MIPKKAFILAAGLGTRMRPLTDNTPKPMVPVWGAPMIDHALRALGDIGVTECVVNTHYKAEILQAHLAAWNAGGNAPFVHVSHEPALLDTGGGIANARRYFDAPFFVLSGDSVWENTNLAEFAGAWSPDLMDILMLLQPVKSMVLTRGVGDYDVEADGRAVRSLNKTGAHMFTSIRICAPSIFENAPSGAFSYLPLMDRAQEQGRLYGVVNKGAWHHISTPEDVRKVEEG